MCHALKLPEYRLNYRTLVWRADLRMAGVRHPVDLPEGHTTRVSANVAQWRGAAVAAVLCQGVVA
jgi:hypothetical protein